MQIKFSFDSCDRICVWLWTKSVLIVLLWYEISETFYVYDTFMIISLAQEKRTSIFLEP